MTGVEILLLVIGVVFFIASFFITEKLSSNELSKIGELSNGEIQKVMERELAKVTSEIGSRVEEKVEESLVESECCMEKVSNEKIMAINEYSDTVVESMNKTHNEIMFLYSMLNDKHVELTKLSSEMQKLASDLELRDESIVNRMMEINQKEEVRISASEKAQVEEEHFEEIFSSMEEEESNYNKKILSMHKQGKSIIEIARELGLGLGEVQLVIGLYRGDKSK